MKVRDLISHLQSYVAQSPENSHAEVRIQFFDDQCYGILGANNAKGVFDKSHMLVIVPDFKDKIGVKRMRVQ